MGQNTLLPPRILCNVGRTWYGAGGSGGSGACGGNGGCVGSGMGGYPYAPCGGGGIGIPRPGGAVGGCP